MSDGVDTAERYRVLHWGREPAGVTEVVRPRGAPVQHTALGHLVELHIAHVVTADDVLLTEGTDGELWLLSPGGVRLPKGWHGEISRIVYDTCKGRQCAWFDHAHERPLPRLGADRQGHSIIVRGDSRYYIDAEGIHG